VENLRFPQHLFPKIGTEVFCSVQIRLSPEYFGKLPLHGEKGQSGSVSRLKFHENVDIALGREILSKNRTKKGQFPNVVPSAELPHFFRWDRNWILHGESREMEATTIMALDLLPSRSRITSRGNFRKWAIVFMGDWKI
jgi:hypothetical protein